MDLSMEVMLGLLAYFLYMESDIGCGVHVSVAVISECSTGVLDSACDMGFYM